MLDLLLVLRRRHICSVDLENLGGGGRSCAVTQQHRVQDHFVAGTGYPGWEPAGSSYHAIDDVRVPINR